MWVKKLKKTLKTQNNVVVRTKLSYWKSMHFPFIKKNGWNKVEGFPDWVTIEKKIFAVKQEKKRQAAHVICTLNNRRTFSKYLPITLHNLCNYEAHFFLKNYQNWLLRLDWWKINFSFFMVA